MRRRCSSPDGAPQSSLNTPPTLSSRTFINEMADLCEQCGADLQKVARGMRLDRRIAGKFLHAGPGFGGSCFPKDTAALAAIGQRYGVLIKIVETVMGVNNARKRAMAAKVVAACGGRSRAKPLQCWA
jgi:UDPglucose 6-dehydrogenase